MSDDKHQEPEQAPWICPRCGAVWAPLIDRCWRCWGRTDKPAFPAPAPAPVTSTRGATP